MTRILSLITLIWAFASCSSEEKIEFTSSPIEGFPSYKEVVNKFCSGDHFIDRSYSLSFGRKADGWYIIEKKASERDDFGYKYELAEEHLFWSAAEDKYQEIELEAKASRNSGSRVVAEYYLRPYFAERFGFQVFYGYDGWQEDVIQELGQYTWESLPDSLLYGYARAYKNLILELSQFEEGKKLGSYEAWGTLDDGREMEDDQWDMLVEYRKKSIEVLSVLEERNPEFQGVLGSLDSEIGNEIITLLIHGKMFGKTNGLEGLLDQVTYEPGDLEYARNLLHSCPENAILVANGDNDLLPLFYCQLTENLRTDVKLISETMLTFSHYVEYIKNEKGVEIKLPMKRLANKNVDAFVFQGERRIIDKYVNLRSFLDHLTSKETLEFNQREDVPYPTYGTKNLFLFPERMATRNLIAQGDSLPEKLRFKMTGNSLLYLSRVVLLDIIESNIDKSPICFTSISHLTRILGLQSNAFFHGMVVTLMPVEGEHSLMSTQIDILNEPSFKFFNDHYHHKEHIASKFKDQAVFRGMHYKIFLNRLALSLNDSADAQKLDKVIATLEELPLGQESRLFVDLESAEILYEVGQLDKGDELIHRIWRKVLEDHSKNMNELEGKKREEYISMTNSMVGRIQVVYMKYSRDLQLKRYDQIRDELTSLYMNQLRRNY